MSDVHLRVARSLARSEDAGLAKRAIAQLGQARDPSIATLEVLVAVLVGEPPLSAAAALALRRIGPPAFGYLEARLADSSTPERDLLRERAKQVTGFADYQIDSSVELAELHAQARGTDGEQVYSAVEKLAGIEPATGETIELLIDLMTSELRFESDFSDPWGYAPTFHVKDIATRTIEGIGPKAIEALCVRIASPAKPGDEKLLERSVEIGRPMFELARILVTDGDAARSRMAEPIVAKFASELPIDEAVSIYLAVCDRERAVAPASEPQVPRIPDILREIWPRLGTPEGRAVIAERWTARGLWPWLEERLDGEPTNACRLLALLLAGPPEPDIEKRIRELLAPMKFSATQTAIESMLFVDPVRMGEVIAGDRALYDQMARATTHTLVLATGEREHRQVIAFGGNQDLVTELDKYVITLDAFLQLIAKLRPPRLREALAVRQANPAYRRATIGRALEAIERGVVPGA